MVCPKFIIKSVHKPFLVKIFSQLRQIYARVSVCVRVSICVSTKLFVCYASLSVAIIAYEM